MPVCEQCGLTLRVRRGVCRRCRRRSTDVGPAATSVREQLPRSPDLEPPHSRPWIHRGGG